MTLLPRPVISVSVVKVFFHTSSFRSLGIRSGCALIAALVIAVLFAPTVRLRADVVRAELNGLALEFDSLSGGLVRMSYPGTGVLVETTPDLAGLVEAAVPLPEFEALRLASRFSKEARIRISQDAIVIHYDSLGLSRATVDIGGPVSVEVQFRAAPDQRSIILTCSLTNHSKVAIPQVIFPQLREIPPFGGREQMVYRTASSVSRPWLELQAREEADFWPMNRRWDAVTTRSIYKATLPWVDLGSIQGGFSVFPRTWSAEQRVPAVLFLPEKTQKLQMLFMHDRAGIKPGASWQSAEFWLTPHRQGWAKGIEPFREWVGENYKPLYPMPAHIRNGLGFRTVCMREYACLPSDPRGDIVWRFKDLVPLAREAKEHGLTELCVWDAFPIFRLPIPPCWPELGTEAELAEAVRQCKQLGVNLSLFISVRSMDRESCERYGWTFPEKSTSWNRHTELIPPFAPYYCNAWACRMAETTDKRWQEDVITSIQRLMGLGITSFGWDQFSPKGVYEVSDRIRRIAKAADPDSTYSGELLGAYEGRGIYQDYTWVWQSYGVLSLDGGIKGMDHRPLTSVIPSPRNNCNIHRSVRDVRLGFADNLFLNLQPSSPDGINGSAWITNYPETSQAVKQCARLREQFLPYFTQGRLIGECLLARSQPQDLHLTAYVLPDRALAVVVNKGDRCGKLNLSLDLEPWLTDPAANYQVRVWRQNGRLDRTLRMKGKSISIPDGPLERNELALYELLPATRAVSKNR